MYNNIPIRGENHNYKSELPNKWSKKKNKEKNYISKNYYR